jgi:hypothetical protein
VEFHTPIEHSLDGELAIGELCEHSGFMKVGSILKKDMKAFSYTKMHHYSMLSTFIHKFSQILETFVQFKICTKITQKKELSKVGLHKGHASRTTPMFLAFKRYRFYKIP